METLSNDEKLAPSGTVTLTKVTKDQVDGTFELTFASGSLKGSFSAPMCREFIIREVVASGFTCLP